MRETSATKTFNRDFFDVCTLTFRESRFFVRAPLYCAMYTIYISIITNAESALIFRFLYAVYSNEFLRFAELKDLLF